MNKQREQVYALRRELLEGKISLGEGDGEPELLDTRGYLMAIAEELIANLVETHAAKDQDPEQWDLGALGRAIGDTFGLEPAAIEALNLENVPSGEMTDRI